LKTKIIILTLERPIQFRDMIKSIEEYTDPSTYEIVICDNGSSGPVMVEYLRSLESKYKIYYNGENKKFEGLNPALKNLKNDYFIISDSDIMLQSNIPHNWIYSLRRILNEHLDVPKAGFALDINFNKESLLTNKIRSSEREHWAYVAPVTAVPDECFYAKTDTTLCMYRKDTFSYWVDSDKSFSRSRGLAEEEYIRQDLYNAKYKLDPIRVAGRFAAKHLGWYTDAKYLPDIEAYKEKCDPILASTLRHMTELIKAHHAK